jgi:hypothetical protein
MRPRQRRAWFRHCGLCGRVDDRRSFGEPEDGIDSGTAWICQDCGLGAELEYVELPIDLVYDRN